MDLGVERNRPFALTVFFFYHQQRIVLQSAIPYSLFYACVLLVSKKTYLQTFGYHTVYEIFGHIIKCAALVCRISGKDISNNTAQLKGNIRPHYNYLGL